MLRMMGKILVGLVLGLGIDQTAYASVHPTATVTITGAEQPVSGGWDSGTITISFNGHSHSVSYGQFSTPSSIASAFAAEFSSYPASAWPRLCSIGVCAKANGATITFQLSGSGPFTSPVIIGPSTSFSVNASAWPTTPVITWPAPSPITYGTPLNATQLDAIATAVGGMSVPGTFSYSPAAGTILSAGSQTLQVTFTPINLAMYNIATANVSLTVGKALPTIVATASPQPAAPGIVVVLSVLLPQDATGTAYFSDGGTPIGSGTITNGIATLDIATLSTGTHTINAQWPGDLNYLSAQAQPILEEITNIAPRAAGIINTVVGDGLYVCFQNGVYYCPQQSYIVTGPATSVSFWDLHGQIATDQAGNVYIPSSVGAAIFKYTPPTGPGIDPQFSPVRPPTVGTVSQIAGGPYSPNETSVPTAPCSYSPPNTFTCTAPGDGGSALGALLEGPSAVAVNSVGDVYIRDGSRIRKIDALTATISTIAGNGLCQPGVETSMAAGQSALSVDICDSGAIAAGPGDLVYFTTRGRVLKLDQTTGIVTTVAGSDTSSPVYGYSGDGEPATMAILGETICELAVDSLGNLFIADCSNNVVRRVDVVTGIITTVAGGGTVASYLGMGGAATSVSFGNLGGVAIDPLGDFFVSDSAASIVQKVDPHGVLSSIAGTVVAGFSGDGGPAINAELYAPDSVAVDLAGNIYIADRDNARIRVVGPQKEQPILTWIPPAPIVYGTTLANLLNPTSNVPGIFSYTVTATNGQGGTINVDSSTVLSAGSYILSAAFTPSDTSTYFVGAVSVRLRVRKGVPLITWAVPAPITSATNLGSAQLDAVSSVAGTFTYSPNSGTLSPGAHQLSVGFVPTDTTNFENAQAQVMIDVSGPTPTVFDHGTLQLNVNNVAVASVPYDSTSTPETLASALSNAVVAGSPVTVQSRNDLLYVTSTTAGSSSNYSYSLQGATSDPTDFGQASFSGSPASGNLAGGADPGGSGSTVYSFTVPANGYSKTGNLLQYSDSVTGDWNYSYDTLSRLIGGSTTWPAGQITNYCWSYDPFGNRLLQASSAGTFDNSNASTPCQLPTGMASSTLSASYQQGTNRVVATSQSPIPFSYDSSGDVVADGTNQYLYDAEGRICAVANKPISGGLFLTGYVYGPDGVRVAKGTITSWSCDPTTNGFAVQEAYALDLDGRQSTEMTADSSGALTWAHTNVFASGTLIGTYDTAGYHLYLNDALGTRRVQVDPRGQVEQTCFSLPYGDGLNCSGSLTAPTEQHFTGKERDPESGLDYFAARYYSSSIGRFMSPDPKSASAHPEDPQTWNRYMYGLNKPLKTVDPDGKEPIIITVYTWIPWPTTWMFGTYSGGPKTVSRFTVETDPRVSTNPIIAPAVENVQPTVKYNSDGSVADEKTAPASAEARGTRASDGSAIVLFTQSDGNPLSPVPPFLTPNITVGLTLKFSPDGSTITGGILNSAFPAMQATATYPDGTTRLLYSQMPTTNTTLQLFYSSQTLINSTPNQPTCGSGASCQTVPTIPTKQ